MAYHNMSGHVIGGNSSTTPSFRDVAGEMLFSEYSGEERDSRSFGERPDSNLSDTPVYLLEHLATFTVNEESGIVYPADGMRRLLQLEKTTGIWSQKMQLCLEYQWVLIMDYETGNIIERFPASLIQEPTAFTSTDAMELYNNILVFIVSGRNGSRSEMHIFQSQSVSAVHLVEDFKSLKTGKMVTHHREDTLHMLQSQQHNQIINKNVGRETSTCGMTKSSALHGHHNQKMQHFHQQSSNNFVAPSRSLIDVYSSHFRSSKVECSDVNGGVRCGNGEMDSEHGALQDETSSTSSDKYERDVTVLNHCFDDIEKFIARLQHVAAASRELERRRHNRKTKKRDPGEGLLTLRTRPPHETEFLDIFAKFKLSFNLLAKLKAHIHDPNAPELVHFLFTPLALIVEASSDTYYESQLPARVVNPLLTREAINLLINCVTSKETELWRSLGDAWIIPRDQWKTDVGSYHPVFMDGWSPDFLVVDELEKLSITTNVNKGVLEAQTHFNVGHAELSCLNGRPVSGNNNFNSTTLHISQVEEYETNAPSEKYSGHYERDRVMAVDIDVGAGEGGRGDITTRSEISVDSIERCDILSLQVHSSTGGNIQPISNGMQQFCTRDIKNAIGVLNSNAGRKFAGCENTTNDDQLLETWLNNLKVTDATIVIVTYPRTANNDKELSVVRGEYLEVLDDTRKWWKVRNIRGQVAHVPYTIVTPYNYRDDPTSHHFNGQQVHSQQQEDNYLLKSHSKQAANTVISDNIDTAQDTTNWIRNKQWGKKGAFRYF